ncbi:hypothetical protein ACWFR5_37270 [Streptomyces sp. NPDC055092]
MQRPSGGGSDIPADVALGLVRGALGDVSAEAALSPGQVALLPPATIS